MSRFNFICHGLMWIVEEGNTIQILIPKIGEHSFRQGQPASGCLTGWGITAWNRVVRVGW